MKVLQLNRLTLLYWYFYLKEHFFSPGEVVRNCFPSTVKKKHEKADLICGLGINTT